MKNRTMMTKVWNLPSHIVMCRAAMFHLRHNPPPLLYPLSLHDALPISSADRGRGGPHRRSAAPRGPPDLRRRGDQRAPRDRKSTRLNSSHVAISYAVFCLKKKK